MKKTLAVTIALVLVLSLIPATALAADTITVSNSAQLAAALTGAADGDTIFLLDGEYTLDQTTLNMNLTIIGESEAGVVLKPTGDTGAYSRTAGDTSGWLFLQTGSLSISNLTMDGSGFLITQALRTNGALTVKNVTIKNIEYSQYFGFGIGVYQPGSLDATNVTMSNIARVGIHAKGETTVDGFNYTGKGAITCLDYALEIGTFNGSMTPFSVSVTNATITDCLGVADDSAGSGSGAIYINTYFYQADGGTDSLITINISQCTISNSSTGIYIGYYDKGEYSDTVVSDSNFVGCETDLYYSGLAGTSTFTTSGNYFGGGAPTASVQYGNTIIGIDDYVVLPVPMDTDTEVTAGIDPNYTIIIPATVDFGTLIKDTGIASVAFDVSATGLVLEPGASVDVTVSSDFLMRYSSADLPYALYNTTASGVDALEDGDSFASFEEDGTHNGRAEVDTSNIENAGSFEDTMVFTITYME